MKKILSLSVVLFTFIQFINGQPFSYPATKKVNILTTILEQKFLIPIDGWKMINQRRQLHGSKKKIKSHLITSIKFRSVPN